VAITQREGVSSDTFFVVCFDTLLNPPLQIFLSGGSRDIILEQVGFKRKVMSTSAAMGLVAHFENGRTEGERNMEEFSWASQYNLKLFG
jgi:hypothetical protein